MVILDVEYCDFLRWLVLISLIATADEDVASEVHCKGELHTIPCKRRKLTDLDCFVDQWSKLVHLDSMSTDKFEDDVTNLHDSTR